MYWFEYINNHLGEDIDLNKLAEISGFSRWHFHRINPRVLRGTVEYVYR